MTMPNFSGSSSSSASGRGDQTTGDLRSGQGLRSSIVNNYALDGSRLSAATGNGSEIPTWVYWAGGALVVAFFVWQYVRK